MAITPNPLKSFSSCTDIVLNPETVWIESRFNVHTGMRYLGDFIGDRECKHDWLKVRINTWDHNICKISETSEKYSQ